LKGQDHGSDADPTDANDGTRIFGVDDLFIAYQPLSNLSGANDLFNS